MNSIRILDCTLRDGAYIVNGVFGEPAIRGIINKLQNANIDIIECGWLKNDTCVDGTTYYHLPSDLEKYLSGKSEKVKYVAMIDWDRYDLQNLPECDGKSIDAIRVVFPHNHYAEGMALGGVIKNKGYEVFFQAANTLAYSDEELVELATIANQVKPSSLSIVDTFGAMYGEDLSRIVNILDNHLDKDIALGFHSHNNQQMSFALSMQFIDMLKNSGRDCIVDSSLCGMGRGAGNATTELVVNYINRKYGGNYDMNEVMDAIDMYMQYFLENYSWGYSIPYFIAGMYCTHVNNIAYLLKNHRTNAKDMRNIVESLSEEDRKKYDYDLLEDKYLDYQGKVVDDSECLSMLEEEIQNREVLLILPGRSIHEEEDKIKNYIVKNNPLIIGINAVFEGFNYDYVFFSNKVRYNYAKEIYPNLFNRHHRIVASNIKIIPEANESIVNYNLLIKRGWEHFDNSGIMCLRLLNKVHAKEVVLAGFDGFDDDVSNSYADKSLPHINPGKAWSELNSEIKDMLQDFMNSTKEYMNIRFLTKSRFE